MYFPYNAFNDLWLYQRFTRTLLHLGCTDVYADGGVENNGPVDFPTGLPVLNGIADPAWVGRPSYGLLNRVTARNGRMNAFLRLTVSSFLTWFCEPFVVWAGNHPTSARTEF